MEHVDLCGIDRGWAAGKGGGSIERLILFVEEEVLDKLIEVCLTYVFTECLE